MLKKGTKFIGGYAVTKNGEEYRSISKRLGDEMGIEMSASSVRNYVLYAMSKIALDLAVSLDIDIDEEEISKSPLFQEAVSEILFDN